MTIGIWLGVVILIALLVMVSKTPRRKQPDLKELARLDREYGRKEDQEEMYKR